MPRKENEMRSEKKIINIDKGISKYKRCSESIYWQILPIEKGFN
jgi:hypothetical protein